jgi:predicted dehydrogenase
LRNSGIDKKDAQNLSSEIPEWEERSGFHRDDPNVLNVHNALNVTNDTLNVSLSYENGSVGTISYFAYGDKSLPKERVEIFAHGCTAVLDDFKELVIFAGGKKKRKKLISQDKGQKEEVRAFIDAVIEGKEPPIPYDELFSTSLVTFKILESIQSGQAQRLG